MRLCLDEHYPREIAELLRGRGHDVSSVAERPELQGLPDVRLVEVVVAERSALMTENVRDFVPLERDHAAGGLDHWGFVYASSRSLPRRRDTIGTFVAILDRFLSERPGEDDFRNQVWWLQPSP